MTADERRYLDERFKGVKEQLDRIEEHVKLTNGRVSKLEDQKLEIQHYIDTHPGTCPNLDKIKKTEERISDLEKKLEDAFFFLRHPKLFVAGFTVVIILSLATFLSNNPLKIFYKEPTKELILEKAGQLQDSLPNFF